MEMPPMPEELSLLQGWTGNPAGLWAECSSHPEGAALMGHDHVETGFSVPTSSHCSRRA